MISVDFTWQITCPPTSLSSLNLSFGMTIFICDIQKKKKKRLNSEKKSCLWFPRAENWWKEIQDKGCWKVQSSSYKINTKHVMYNKNSYTAIANIKLWYGPRNWIDTYPKNIYKWPISSWHVIQHFKRYGDQTQHSCRILQKLLRE